MGNVIELVRDRMCHRHESQADLDLCITGVVRAGAAAVTPAPSGEPLRVGDRLIGSYRASGRGDAQLAIRRRATRARALEPHATRSLDASATRTTSPAGSPIASPAVRPIVSQVESGLADEVESETWELDTSNMRPGDYSLTLREISLELGADLGDERAETRCHAAFTIEFRLAARARPLARAVAITG